MLRIVNTPGKTQVQFDLTGMATTVTVKDDIGGYRPAMRHGMEVVYWKELRYKTEEEAHEAAVGLLQVMNRSLEAVTGVWEFGSVDEF